MIKILYDQFLMPSINIDFQVQINPKMNDITLIRIRLYFVSSVGFKFVYFGPLNNTF